MASFDWLIDSDIHHQKVAAQRWLFAGHRQGMNFIKCRHLLLTASVTVALGAGTICRSEEISTKGCIDATDYGEMARCSIARQRMADDELNQVFRRLMSDLEETDKLRLGDSQNAWLVYRDKVCLFEVGPTSDGYRTWTMDNAHCEEKLTKQRVEILRYRLGPKR